MHWNRQILYTWLCITDSNSFNFNYIFGNFGLLWWVPDGRSMSTIKDEEVFIISLLEKSLVNIFGAVCAFHNHTTKYGPENDAPHFFPKKRGCLLTYVIHPSHWENYISSSFPIEWDMIVVTVFLSILNQMEFHLVQNRKENCYHDHIPFDLKGNGHIVFSVFLKWNFFFQNYGHKTQL